jgi:Zn-dependent peptidase ImmA (M78 family)/transcriptional regulator with XRE-family HTH domain
MQKLSVKINPRVLEWARMEAGFTIPEISERLKVGPERYSGWEQHGSEIPWGKLCQVSKLYRRQVAVFFLETVPPIVKKPSDFRNSRLSSAGISKDVLLAIRRVNKYLRLAIELFGEEYWSQRHEWLMQDMPKQDDSTSKFSMQFSQWLRNRIGISLDTQRKARKIRDMYKDWRNNIENNLGIFVFQFSMPTDEIQAFCYGESPPFGIVLNSNDAYARRIFSLFHELAHIFRYQSGMCFPDDIDKNDSLELACNEFAGKFLIPDEFVPMATTIELLSSYADDFKVSREVILLRNLERKLITRKLFSQLWNEVRSQPREKGKGGPVTPINKSKNARGELFFNLIMNAMNANKIDFNTASDVLGLRLNYLT